MKKILSLIVVLMLFISYFTAVHSKESEFNVLFIGNSLTSANNLPDMLADIAKSHGYKVIYDSHTPGGARLANHSSDHNVLRKINTKTWDFVVLQEQSQYPGFSRKQLSKDVFPYAKSLSAAVRKANDQSKVVFYMTMARRNGDPDNKHVSSELLTYEGMQKRVNSCYITMGRNNNALVAPVGKVWEVVRRERPNLNLYADDVHPNRTGTYLAACVFYVTLFGETSSGSYIPDDIDPESAEYIQMVVDRIALR